jgi:HSP20 family protein
LHSADERGRYHVVERSWGTFQRSFQLPLGIEEDKIEASFNDGVLTVRIPKAALPQPRRIQIKGAGAGGQEDRQRVSGPRSADRSEREVEGRQEREPRAAREGRTEGRSEGRTSERTER